MKTTNEETHENNEWIQQVTHENNEWKQQMK